ncbi:MAG: putative DNA base hypermodification protein [Gammaproteobacteria bacterium]|nr:putative DNA base hypermodification protein [Gammaproteobacteria bacterium]
MQGNHLASEPTLFDRHDPLDRVPTPPALLAAAPGVRVTEAYDAWWWFACERQNIYFHRLHGAPSPWTDDEILRGYRFTNAYRVADRVSQYLVSEVIYHRDLPKDPSEVVFRILLFKLFNRIETWEVLTRQMGPIVLAERPFGRIAQILSDELCAGRRIYSAAYIMPTRRTGSRGERKHQMHLQLLELMMEDCLAERLTDAGSMKEGYDLLRSYPSIGNFLAYQYITDINYSEAVEFSEEEFVAAGPGAQEGLRKCFADKGDLTHEDLIRVMMDIQEEEFERLGLDFQSLFGRRLQLIDCQNLFCEVAKYARVRFPRLTPPGGRVRIKQKFQPAKAIEAPFFPPKWGINGMASNQLALCDRPGVDLAHYQRRASATSLNRPVEGGDAITTPMLGLIGEMGEVVSELKKRAREGAAYDSFRDRLGEELGDLLWYMAEVATRRGIRLTDIHRQATRLGDPDTSKSYHGRTGWIRLALSLADEMGRIAAVYRALLADAETESTFNATLTEAFVELLRNVTALSSIHGMSLGEITERNLSKVVKWWTPPSLHTATDVTEPPETEQIPRRFDAWLEDHDGRVSVSFTVDGRRMSAAPDTLTDNAYDSDGYRFHDVFHFAYAAILDWSPVTRRLLHRKRKSNPQTDEVEDGGRAIAIEEGIAALVFASAKQHGMFEGVDSIADSTLRTIRDMCGGLEVRRRTLAEWEDAILQGFSAWRHVKAAGGGRVHVDRTKRQITFVEDETSATKNLELPLS